MSHIEKVNANPYNFVNEKFDSKPKTLLALMEELSQVMNLFESSIAKFDSEVQELQATTANDAAKVAEKMADKAQKQIKKIAAEKKKAEDRSFWGKIVHDVLPAVGVAVGVILCFVIGPEVGIPIMLLSVALAFEAPQKFAGFLTKVFENAGIPAKYAKPLADLTVLVIFVVGTLGVASLLSGGEVAAEMAVEEGIEEGTETATETAAESATEEGAEESQSFVKTIVNKVLQTIGPRGGLTLTAISELLGSLNFDGDILDAIPMSEKKREKMGLILEIVEMVTSLLMALVGGGAMANAASTAMEVTEESSIAQRAFAKIQQMLLDHPTALTATLAAVQGASGTTSAAYQFVASFDKYKIAKYMEELTPLQAGQILANSSMKIADRSLEKSTKQFSLDINAIKEMLKIVYHMGDVMGAVAKATA